MKNLKKLNALVSEKSLENVSVIYDRKFKNYIVIAKQENSQEKFPKLFWGNHHKVADFINNFFTAENLEKNSQEKTITNGNPLLSGEKKKIKMNNVVYFI
jgi:hypothetical protein